MTEIRIQKYIRDLTGISLRRTEELISSGRVVVNGVKAVLGLKIDPDNDDVVVNGLVIKGEKQIEYVMLNKKSGYMTTRYDPNNPKTVYRLIPDKYAHLVPVGRLDIDTEGLLLFTNDGNLVYRMTHPKFEVEKEYYAEISGLLTPSEKSEIEKGIRTDNFRTSPAKIGIIRSTNSQTRLNITIHEGQNHEVKRIFGYFGHKMMYLKRVRVASLKIGELKPGQWRILTSKEISELKNIN